MGWSSALSLLTDTVQGWYSVPATVTRSGVSVVCRGILDRAAAVGPVSPGDIPIELTQPRIDIEIAAMGALGRLTQGDTVDADGTSWEVVRVEEGTPGSVVGWLVEVQE